MFGHRVVGRVGVMLLAVSLLGACGASAAPSPTAPSPVPVAPSPTANPDQALVDDLAAVWSSPYDAAKVAALYTPDAVLHDNSANETSTGLAAIQAKVQKYAALKFKVANKSAPIRQGNFVAIFCRFGQDTARYPALAVYELRDGKVVNQWVYPAP